jgi:hypothetical protein
MEEKHQMSMQSIHKAEIEFPQQTLQAKRINRADWLTTVSKGNKIERKVIIRTSAVEELARLGSRVTKSCKLGVRKIPHHKVAPVTDKVCTAITDWISRKQEQGKIVLNDDFDVSDILELTRQMMEARIRAHRQLSTKKKASFGFAKKESKRV